jgi:hypothetical protein
MYFLKPFFLVPGPFQGEHFLGIIIYSSALDLQPAALNLRPALRPLHACYTTGTCIRWGMAVTVTYNHDKFVTVSLLKRKHNGRFTSETAVGHLDPEVV